MTELMRPALYGAFHRIVAVAPRAGPTQRYEVVGPLCESSDIFGRDRLLPPLEVGDLVAILDTGAYGSVMASIYNRRPLAARSAGRRRLLARHSATADDRRFARAGRVTNGLRAPGYGLRATDSGLFGLRAPGSGLAPVVGIHPAVL